MEEKATAVSANSLQESRQDIDRSASELRVLLRDARELKSDFQGEVVAVTNHHVLLRISEMVAVRYEKAAIDQSVSPGDKVFMRNVQDRTEVYQPGKEPAREASRDMERDLG